MAENLCFSLNTRHALLEFFMPDNWLEARHSPLPPTLFPLPLLSITEDLDQINDQVL